MAVDVVSPALAIRSSVGIELWASSGPKLPYEQNPNLPREETKNSRSITFSPEGRYFAYSNGQEVKVLQTCDWKVECTLPRPKAFYLKFSPRGTYLCTWEHYVTTKDRPEGTPNMFVYELATGAEVFSIVQKHQADWEPSWSTDELIFAIVVGGEALIYDLSSGVEGFKTTTRKIGGSRGGMLSLGPGASPYVAFYTPGTKGGPSMCKLYKYPALAQNQAVGCKSFFQADRVEMLWNKRGTGLLLLTSTDVDKSGASYYGNQALHFMATKGDSCSVPLSKEGPVHCVEWSPRANEFVVVYGLMPSKASLYNLKCDVVFDFGEGPRNSAYFNAFGNLLVLAGFGNLPGNVEIWDMKKREKLSNIKCPDTTYFEWNPNGEYFITATTAPRLRIGNGFKIYHYSGALMHETIFPQGRELYSVEWQQFPENTFTEPIITKAKQEGIKSSQPEASKAVYTPPHLRMMKEGKDPEQFVPQLQSTNTGSPAGYNSVSQKQKQQKANRQQRQKKDKESNSNFNLIGAEGAANQKNNSKESITETVGLKGETGNQQQQHHYNHHQQQQQQPQQQQQQQRRPNSRRTSLRKNSQQLVAAGVITSVTGNGNGNVAQNGSALAIAGSEQDMQQQQQQPTKKAFNPEKEKKIRNVAKKLSDIKKLKVRQEQGEVLELNQMNKISMENQFLDELKRLKLSN